MYIMIYIKAVWNLFDFKMFGYAVIESTCVGNTSCNNVALNPFFKILTFLGI
jgi:hypothetical protein